MANQVLQEKIIAYALMQHQLVFVFKHTVLLTESSDQITVWQEKRMKTMSATKEKIAHEEHETHNRSSLCFKMAF